VGKNQCGHAIGYVNIKGMWYVVEKMFHLLSDDNGVINMVNVARHYGEVHLFVVHGVDEVEIVDDVDEEEVGNNVDEEEKVLYLCDAPTLVEEVGEMDGEGGGMEVDVCEEDQVGEMDGQVARMEAEEGEVEVQVCEVQVEGEVGEMDGEAEQVQFEAVEVDAHEEGAEVEAHEEGAKVQVGDASGLNRDSVEGPELVDVDLNVARYVEVEGEKYEILEK